MKPSLWIGLIFFSAALAEAQHTAVPPELSKTFDRYARAWVQADWGRIFDLTSPVIQKIFLGDFETRDAWIKHQAADFKDTITDLESKAVYRISETQYTFAIVTRGKRPGGEPFAAAGFATFQWIENRWYLADPIIPNELKPQSKPTSQ